MLAFGTTHVRYRSLHSRNVYLKTRNDIKSAYLKECRTVLGHQRIRIGFVLVVQRVQIKFLFLYSTKSRVLKSSGTDKRRRADEHTVIGSWYNIYMYIKYRVARLRVLEKILPLAADSFRASPAP